MTITFEVVCSLIEKQHERLQEIREKHAEHGRPIIVANETDIIALYIDGRKELRGKRQKVTHRTD